METGLEIPRPTRNPTWGTQDSLGMQAWTTALTSAHLRVPSYHGASGTCAPGLIPLESCICLLKRSL